ASAGRLRLHGAPAERFGRPLAEERAVGRGEPPQLEEAVIRRDSRHGGPGSGGSQRLSYGFHPAPRKVSLWTRAADGVAGIAKASLAHAGGIAELRQLNGFVEVI